MVVRNRPEELRDKGKLLDAMGDCRRAVTDCFARLPQYVKDHLVCRVVDDLVPVTQKHYIEGSVMGAD